jgi:hypothetical protein
LHVCGGASALGVHRPLPPLGDKPVTIQRPSGHALRPARPGAARSSQQRAVSGTPRKPQPFAPCRGKRPFGFVQRCAESVRRQARRDGRACDGPHPRSIGRRAGAAEDPADDALTGQHGSRHGCPVWRGNHGRGEVSVTSAEFSSVAGRAIIEPWHAKQRLPDRSRRKLTMRRGRGALRRCSSAKARSSD